MLKKYRQSLKWDESYLKYFVLFIFFILLMVLAITLLVVSNDVSERSERYIDRLSQISPIKTSIALTLLSFVIILIAFIGCCATYTRSKLILILFCCLLVLLIIIEIFCTFNSFHYNSKLKNNKIDNKFEELMQKYIWSNESDFNASAVNKIVDEIQMIYNCCGSVSYKSWDPLRPQTVDSNHYPFSCCYHSPLKTSDQCSEDWVNQTNSCYHSFDTTLKEIKRSVSLMAGITIANTLIKLIGFPLLWYFGRQLPENFIV